MKDVCKEVLCGLSRKMRSVYYNKARSIFLLVWFESCKVKVGCGACVIEYLAYSNVNQRNRGTANILGKH